MLGVYKTVYQGAILQRAKLATKGKSLVLALQLKD
jgi:hypothetical protein